MLASVSAFHTPSANHLAPSRARFAMNAASSPAITVVGGTGFVGSRVCKGLVEAGATVTSVSTRGVVPEWCKTEEWTRSVQWKANNLVRGAREEMDAAIEDMLQLMCHWNECPE